MSISPALSSAGANTPAAINNSIPRLHDQSSIGLAAFLGSPMAGALLMAHNLSMLQRSTQAVAALLAGVLLTAVLIGIGMALPAGVSAGPLLPLAVAMGMKKVSENVFRSEYAAIGAGQATARKRWIGLAVGLVCAAVLLGVIFLIV